MDGLGQGGLCWYLSDRRWPDPNLELLRNALEQTGREGPPLDAASWRTVVRDRVESLDWHAAARDIEPFLEPGPAVSLFGRENLLQLIAGPDERE